MHFYWWTLSLQTINFADIWPLLHRFLYKPVLRMIDARGTTIQKQYDDAKVIEGKAKAHLTEIELQRAGIAAERASRARGRRGPSAGSSGYTPGPGGTRCEAWIEATRKTLAVEREHAAAELRRNALDLGVEFARRLLAEVPMQLRTEAWIEQIEQHLAALPKTELDTLIRQFNDGSALTVVTASPLSPEAADIWRTRLGRHLGEGVTIVFAADPDLITGAELHFPAAILRFLLQSALAAMRSEVGTHGNAH